MFRTLINPDPEFSAAAPQSPADGNPRPPNVEQHRTPRTEINRENLKKTERPEARSSAYSWRSRLNTPEKKFFLKPET